MLLWTNASLRRTPLFARRKLLERSAGVPFEEGRYSSWGWEARAKVRQIVISSSSVRVGAAVPQRSGCLRYWKACGRVWWLRWLRLKNLAALVDEFLSADRSMLIGIHEGRKKEGSGKKAGSHKANERRTPERPERQKSRPFATDSG